MDDALGMIADAKYATGGTYARGRIIAYCPAPSYIIEKTNGERFTWRCDLCEIRSDPLTEEELGIDDD